jgi:hypothetical protein
MEGLTVPDDRINIDVRRGKYTLGKVPSYHMSLQ